MNEKLQEQLAEAVSKAIAVAEKTGEFAIDQAPDLLREFYAWAIVENIFFIALGIGFILLGRFLPYMWMPNKKPLCDYWHYDKFFDRYSKKLHKEDSGDRSIPSNIVFVLSSIFGALFILTSLFDLLKVIVSPKLYLIEHFIDVIKTY